jgi:hypothetical protein
MIVSEKGRLFEAMKWAILRHIVILLNISKVLGTVIPTSVHGAS